MADVNEHHVRWTADLLALLDRCVGQHVQAVTIDEMALYGPEDGPYFTHPSLNFIQANVVELVFSTGAAVRIVTQQNDDSWSLRLIEAEAGVRLSPSADESLTLFRVRPMPEFPTGEILSAEPQLDGDNDIQRIRLQIGDRTVTLLAGEVYENMDGSLTVHSCDESVLIFLDHAALAKTIFDRPAYRIVEGGA